MSTEPRQSEAEQAMTPLQTPMPTVGDARRALAIAGAKENFLTLTVTFPSTEARVAFLNLARDEGTGHAILNSPEADYFVVE